MKTPKQNETTPAAAPGWVNKTPPDHCYSLDMYENSDHSIDSVEMTRAEYIALKQHLAGLRGIIIPTAAVPAAEPIATQGEEQQLRARLMERLTGMSVYGLKSMASYADIEEANDGSDTPAEEFIAKLVLSHSVRPLTPEDTARYLEEFREYFDCMVESARNFSAHYPEAVKAASAA